jgi:peptidoglycan-associated lipoprotein
MSTQKFALVACLGLAFGFAACGHKNLPLPTPPAGENTSTNASTAPTITLSADPTAIEAGSQATLAWKSTNAVRVELNGAPVNLNGTQPVNPAQSTDYQIVARGADGQTANAAARITVTQPAAPTATPAPTSNDVGGSFPDTVRDAFFDYDKSDIRPDAEPALQTDAQYFKAHPDVKVLIEGHCDDRGSAEYNLALGDRRAAAVKNYLVSQGVDPNRIQTVSVGKEKPFCTSDSDDCRQQNRRGHFSQAPSGGE